MKHFPTVTTQLNSTNAESREGNTWSVWIRFWSLTGGLLVVQVAWAVFGVLRLCGIGWKDGAGEPMTCFLLWEIASIFVTILLTVTFWISCFVGKKDGTAYFEGSRVVYGASAVLLLLVFCVCFLAAGWCAWTQASLRLQAVLLLAGTVGTIGLEVLAMFSILDALSTRDKSLANPSCPGEQERIASGVGKILGNRDNVMKYLCFSDVPIAFAIGSLSVFVVTYDCFGVPLEEPQMRSFIAGAIALQLLYSNFVLWLEALADYSWGYRLLAKLPIQLRPVRYMLHPRTRLTGSASVAWAKDILKRSLPPRAL